MSQVKSYFPDISLLVTHYNRSSSLERLLRTMQERGISFGAIVVSDDASKPEQLAILEKLKEVYDFELITTPKNKGLANNINKVQAAIKTPYTLYVQEDFVPTPKLAASLQDGLDFMNADASLDIVRFYAYYPYPYLAPFAKGFSRMLYKPWYTRYDKIYYYSDHPHLRRSSFLEKFGKYIEGIKSDKAEYLMCVSFIQHGGKGLFYDDYKGLFDQLNSSDEPSTVQRDNWRQQSKNPLISILRTVYRQVKYNYDLLFTRPR